MDIAWINIVDQIGFKKAVTINGGVDIIWIDDMCCLMSSITRGQTSHLDVWSLRWRWLPLVFRWRAIPYPFLSGKEVANWNMLQSNTVPWQHHFSSLWEGGVRARTCSAVFLLQARYEDDTYTLAYALITYTVLEVPQHNTYSILKCIAVRQFTGMDCL